MNLLPFVLRSKKQPVIEKIGYRLVRRLAADEQGFTVDDYNLVRRLAAATGVPFTGHAEARHYAQSLPRQADTVEETAGIVGARWTAIARALFVGAIAAAVLGLLAFVDVWGGPLLTMLAAAWSFGWRFALAGLVALTGWGVCKLAQIGAEAYRRQRVTDLVSRAAALRAEGEEAEQLMAELEALATQLERRTA